MNEGKEDGGWRSKRITFSAIGIRIDPGGSTRLCCEVVVIRGLWTVTAAELRMVCASV